MPSINGNGNGNGNGNSGNPSATVQPDRKKIQEKPNKKEEKAQDKAAREVERAERTDRRNGPSAPAFAGPPKIDLGDTVSIGRRPVQSQTPGQAQGQQNRVLRDSLNQRAEAKESRGIVRSEEGIAGPEQSPLSPSEEANDLLNKINIADASLQQAIALSERQSAVAASIVEAEEEGDTARADEGRDELRELDEQRETLRNTATDSATGDRRPVDGPPAEDGSATSFPAPALRPSVTAGRDLTTPEDLQRVQDDLTEEQTELRAQQSALQPARADAQSLVQRANAAATQQRPDAVRDPERADALTNDLARRVSSSPPEQAVVNRFTATSSALLNA